MLWYVILSISVLKLTSGEQVYCACANANAPIYREAGRYATLFSVIPTGVCVQYNESLRFVTIDNTSWASLEYAGHTGYADLSLLSIEVWYGACPHRPRAGHDDNCPRIVTRQEWGARPPTHPSAQLPAIPSHVFIHHGAGSYCHTEYECAAKVRSYQHLHIDIRGWWDIGYSFVVGEDGNVYEARGWDKIGAHTYGHNTEGIGISVIGDFRLRPPNDKAINALTQLISCGVNSGKIQTNYTMQGHCDVVVTECPGKAFLNVIHTWSHYHRANGSHCPPMDDLS